MQKPRSFQYSYVIFFNLNDYRTVSGFFFFRVFQGLTLDVIARTAFGYETSVQSNPNDKFIELCREMLGGKRGLFSRILIKSRSINSKTIFHSFHLFSLFFLFCSHFSRIESISYNHNVLLW